MSTAEKQNRINALIAAARRAMLPTETMVDAAWRLGVPEKRLYAAAGAGLASYHMSVNRVQDDIRAAFGSDADTLPQAYFDGYKLETLRGEYAL